MCVCELFRHCCAIGSQVVWMRTPWKRERKPEESQCPSSHCNACSRDEEAASDGDQKDGFCPRHPWWERDWLLSGGFFLVAVLSLCVELSFRRPVSGCGKPGASLSHSGPHYDITGAIQTPEWSKQKNFLFLLLSIRLPFLSHCDLLTWVLMALVTQGQKSSHRLRLCVFMLRRGLFVLTSCCLLAQCNCCPWAMRSCLPSELLPLGC